MSLSVAMLSVMPDKVTNSLSEMLSMVLVWEREVSRMVEWVSVPLHQPPNSTSSEPVPSKVSKSSQEHRTDMSSPQMPLVTLVGRLQVQISGLFLEMPSESMISSEVRMLRMLSSRQITPRV